jgi:hypothetical protein
MQLAKARVFISSGQSTRNKDGLSEKKVVSDIRKKLETLGYQVYIAVEQHSLDAFTRNIISKLEKCEYYLFIDFVREGLETETESSRKIHRGSLFTHQELGIATALQRKRSLFFQEKGIIKRDGIVGFIQANPIEFDDRRKLANVVLRTIRHEGWMPNWTNELVMSRSIQEHEDAIFRPINDLARWYHIKVENCNPRETALGCLAYLKWKKRLPKGRIQTPEPVEFKWKGMKTQGVNISPGSSRYLDALLVFHRTPQTIRLSINQFLVDFSGYHVEYTITGPGNFLLEFVIYSSNFSPVTGLFKLHIGRRLTDIRFSKQR